MSVVTTKLLTAEEFIDLMEAGRSELIRGEVVPMAPPPGAEHGRAAAELAFLIATFVKANKLGTVFAAETGFTVSRNPDTVRAADVAFVRMERLPKGTLTGYIEGSPDLVAEVASPSDRLTDMLKKVDEWLRGGAKSVWLVDPPRRSIDIYRDAGEVVRYGASDVITNEQALPGFTLRVSEVFGGE